MNVLITGANGFIGSHLFKRLKELGHTVVGIDNLSHPCGNDVETHYCDVRYINELEPFFRHVSIVFHLAAQISVDKSIWHPEDTIATNIIGTANVLKVARNRVAKVVFASSSEVYGSSKTISMAEDHPLDAQSTYGASKIAGDRLCHAYNETHLMETAIVRNFNTFGEFQSDDSYGGVIAKFTKAALANQPLVIYGDGTQERDYMHVKDAVQAYELATKLKGVFNFGTGKPIKIIDLANNIISMTNSKSKIEFVAPRKGEVQRLCADITKAKSSGFNPQTDFWKDLEEYIKWKHKDSKTRSILSSFYR